MYKIYTKNAFLPLGYKSRLLLIMKLTTILLITFIIQVSANTYAQKVTYTKKDASLTQVFKEIRKQTGYYILWSSNKIRNTKTIDVDFKNAPLEEVLTECLQDQPLTFTIEERTVLIKKKLVTVNKTLNVTPPVEIKGKVTDDKGQPLPGVNIKLQGTTIGAVTNANGNYSINLPDDSGILVFSFIGFVTQEVAIVGRSPLNIRLIEEVSKLDEIVVVGYGSQRKRDITGAVSNIDVSKLKDIPASSVTKFLVGQAPGVSVKQTTGSPGREFEVIVRGLGSLGAGSQPLYVVDGFPLGTSIGQNLSAADIASITILKDAVSTAIYGARGSNGVVLITTKSAKAGEGNLSVTANYGIQNIPDSRKSEVLNGVEFAQFKKDIFMDKIRYNQNREPAISEVPLNFRYPEQTAVSTNWFEAIQNQNAPFQNYNITLSQGKGDTHSLFSVGYIAQDGDLKNTNYKLFSARANIDGQVNKFINMGLNISGTFSNQNYAGTEGRTALVGMTLVMDPRDPIYKADGTYNSYIGGHDGIFGFPNPLQMLDQMTKNLGIGDVLTNGFVEVSFLKNFKFKSAGNVKGYFSSNKQFTPSTISAVNGPAPLDASASEDAYKALNFSTDQLLTYVNKFGSHSLNVLLGYTAQEETVKGLTASGSQFSSDLTPFLGSAALKSSGSTEYGWSLDAYFSRINYSLKDKYLFTGTFRREGSSRFGAKNKYGNFPAVSAAWRISDESFMPKHSWLTDLKIRSSYGVTGNNNIGNYTSLAFMNANNYILGGAFSSGLVVGSFPNAELGWEKSNQLDIGVDMSAFNNKLTFLAEYYNRITNDMLLSIQLPVISGFTSSQGNVGKVQNKGFEFALGYNTKINQIGFHSNFNISFNRNKVLAIRGPNDEIWNGSLYSTYNVSKIGQPVGMLYGFKVLGIFQNQAEINSSPKQDGAIPGSYKVADTNGDGIVSYDTKDMVPIGNPWPKATWGLTLGGDYKNLDLNVLFTGAQGYDIFRVIELGTMNMDGVYNVLTQSKDRWRSAQNPGNGKYATTNFWKWERESLSRYIYDGSHIWVKNVSLGYTIPKSKLNYMGIRSVRLYTSADNLFLFTRYPGNNPEVNNGGGVLPGRDDEAYPVGRTFSFGAHLTF